MNFKEQASKEQSTHSQDVLENLKNIVLNEENYDAFYSMYLFYVATENRDIDAVEQFLSNKDYLDEFKQAINSK